MKPSEYSLNDPIAAIATALVPAALGIVRTSGKGCIELLAPFFSRPQALLDAKGNTLLHGWLYRDGTHARDSTQARDSDRIDEVMLAVYRGPKSFTGEDAVEIIGHGGPQAVLAVFRLLIKAGFRSAERGEFTFRSFASGHTDLARSEAILEIIGAQTDTARSHAASRLAGSLSAEITTIKNMVLTALAAIEVEIEYPEDEETTKGAFDTQRIADAIRALAELESSWSSERLYRDGARVVLMGRTNAGKSSLFNVLLKEERAIVSEIHGTTRDWLESAADFGGIPVRIFDTAGLRDTHDLIEAEGVERSKNLALDADLVLYLVDGTIGLTEEDTLSATVPVILVWNKADKEGALNAPAVASIPTSASMVTNATTPGNAICAVCPISAKKGLGISELVKKTTELLLGDNRETIRETGLGTERQKNAVRSALLSLNHALQAAEEGFPMDAIAQDLEDALTPLGEITGEVTSGDILDTVFSGFCVGK